MPHKFIISIHAALTLMTAVNEAEAQVPQPPLSAGLPAPKAHVLRPASFKHFIDAFNQADNELYPSFISNEQAWDFLKDNIPLFDCPDRDIMEIYYFRWWTY